MFVKWKHCMNLAVSKQQYLPAIAMVEFKWICSVCTHTNTHTFSQSPYLANRIWQISKQTALGTDWQTDGHTQPKQIGQTRRQRYAHIQQQREDLPLAHGCTHIFGVYAHLSAECKNATVSSSSEPVSLYSCVTVISISVSLLCLSHVSFFSALCHFTCAAHVAAFPCWSHLF